MRLLALSTGKKRFGFDAEEGPPVEGLGERQMRGGRGQQNVLSSK